MINKQSLTMELDAGAAMWMISNFTRKQMFPHLKLQPSKLILKMNTDERMQIVGKLNVYVQYREQRKPLALVVVYQIPPLQHSKTVRQSKDYYLPRDENSTWKR